MRNLLLSWLIQGLKKIGMTDTAEKFAPLISDLITYRRKDIGRFSLISIAGWSFYYLTYALSAWILGIDITLIQILFASAIAALAVMIPISVAGIGTRDAALIYMFQLYSIFPAEAVSLSLLILGLNMFFVFCGLIVYQFIPSVADSSQIDDKQLFKSGLPSPFNDKANRVDN
jgi:uncharacterized membrane protein YbhN (UPF0104 family)